MILIHVHWDPVQCPANDEIAEKTQSATASTFNTTDSSYTFVAGILGSSGSIYYAVQAGNTNSIIVKDSSSGTNLWGKVIMSSKIAAKSFILSDDESYIYNTDTSGTNQIEFFQFSTTDGSFVKKFER